MSLRRSDRVGYLEVVTDFFATVRGSGLLLSSLDLTWVKAWRARGIPADVVCRGLRLGADAHAHAHPGMRPPRHLSYYAPAVDEAFRAARERAVGAA